MGMIMPIGGRGQVVYIPDVNGGPSGPWTIGDTKITIAICIVFFVVSLLSIIIEWLLVKRNNSFKEYIQGVLTCGLGSYGSYEPSVFTTFMVMIFYIVFGVSVIGFLIYGLTTIM